MLALVGLVLYRKGQRNSSVVLAGTLLITLGYTLARTKLLTYIVPTFPFVSLLAAMALRTLLKKAKYALAAALCILPLYVFFQCRQKPNLFFMNYSKTYHMLGPITSRREPMMHLLRQSRAAASDPNPAPLIICLDNLVVEKQQYLFYSNRPVIETFVLTAPDESRESPYWAPIPIAAAVGLRPSPIIARVDLYRALTYSSQFNLQTVTTDGPLVLGWISRR